MIQPIRHSFNRSFDSAAYERLLQEFERNYPGALDFRVAETPVFIDRSFTQQLLDTCEYVIDRILEPDFMKATQRSIPERWKIPGNEGRPDFLAFDFGVCSQETGQFSPQLIELQGFPTLFGYQSLLANAYREFFDLDPSFSPFLSGLDQASYQQLLRQIILGEHDPKEVVLLEIVPDQQKTRIDFYITSELLKIPIACLTELREKNGDLFYERNGTWHPIKRIYNRIIFDELEQQPDRIRNQGALLSGCHSVEWCPHPHWFYRVSKFLLPYLHHPGVPKTYFLNEVKQIPADLSQFVLKPLFSFAGQGVIIDPSPGDLANIPDPENWILQQKVTYAPLIPTPDDPAKVEIRLFYFWPTNASRPIPTLNLARLSKGKMIGTRYNKDRSWVGGSVCFFESRAG